MTLLPIKPLALPRSRRVRPLLVVLLVTGIAAPAISALLPSEEAAPQTPIDISDPGVIRQLAERGMFPCPERTELAGAAPPGGHEIWCEVNGVRNGPSIAFGSKENPTDFITFTGTYLEGRLDGRYIEWGRNGARWDEGEYRNGRRVWSRRGTPDEEKGALAMSVGFYLGLVLLGAYGWALRRRGLMPARGLPVLRLAVWPPALAYVSLLSAAAARFEGDELGDPVLTASLALGVAALAAEFLRVRKRRSGLDPGPR